MTRMPTLFVSHGGPNVVVDPSDARDFLMRLANDVPKPQAIVLVSAHFEAAGPAVVHDPAPEMIYDFSGFAPELYQMHYPAPGHPELAGRVMSLLCSGGYRPERVDKRGYDHGAWNPLILAFPQADIPVVQVSVDPDQDARWHHGVGRALAPLRDDGVLILGSGHITHNLREIMARMRGAPGTPDFPSRVGAFTDWFHTTLTGGNPQKVLDWRNDAPFVSDNHPTDEHLMPIFAALGAAGDDTHAERIHASTQFDGAFAWDAYRFAASAAD